MKKLKIALCLALALCLCLALVACGGDDSSSSEPASTPPASVSSTPAGSEPASGGEPATDGQDLQAIADALVAGADIETPIDMMELDLKAGGVPMDSVDSFVGVQSQNYSDNGGMVLVIRAKSGMATSVVDGVESFKASRQDDRYVEFATQVANTKEGRIATSGDVVVFAVSASADWTKLDAALTAEGFAV